jgi:ribonuclease HI
MLPHPRRGGIGIVFVYCDQNTGEEVTREFPERGYKGESIGAMELMASIEAIKNANEFDELYRFNKIIMHTDSKYVAECYRLALFQWPTKRWRKVGGAPVQNTELWKELISQVKRISRRVEIEWTKGHSDNPHNRRADRLAKDSAKMPRKEKRVVVSVRRKLSPNKTKPGCVVMRGQKVLIRIIEAKYLKAHRLFRYRYEILSKQSKYYQLVDFIFCQHPLRDGHSYWVKFNRAQGNPMISNVIGEADKTGRLVGDQESEEISFPHESENI